MKKDWIIFYDDGSHVDSDTDVYDVPRVGVQVIVVRDHNVGYRMHHSVNDYFVYDEDRNGWRITDVFGVWDHLTTVRQPLVLFGREMANKDWKALYKKVVEHCGPKQGWLQYERRAREPETPQ